MTAVEHRFGPYGGQYVPETLMPALSELEAAWVAAREDAAYRGELSALLRDYVGRPTPLYRAARLSAEAGHEIWLKREDLNHTGAGPRGARASSHSNVCPVPPRTPFT